MFSSTEFCELQDGAVRGLDFLKDILLSLQDREVVLNPIGHLKMRLSQNRKGLNLLTYF